MHQILVEAATIKSIYATKLNIFIPGEKIKETFRFCSFFCRAQRAFNPAILHHHLADLAPTYTVFIYNLSISCHSYGLAGF